MKIRNFLYYKEKEKINKSYKVIAIKEDDNYIEGVSLNDLTKEKQDEVLAIVKEFEAKLEPFMANYRKFKKTLIVKMNE